MPIPFINARIKALREERGLKQDELARLLGFKDRQTVSAIETGARQVSADELLLLAKGLDVPLDHFIDPLLLVGEGDFTWRQTGSDAKQLDAYESKAKEWLAAFRTLAPEVGHSLCLLRHTLGLTFRSTFEDAMQAGEWFAEWFELGAVPAERLAKVMEKELGILVLMVDMPEGISAAACRLSQLDTVLVSRNEVAGRRHFNLAHELFHLLTWDAMPPEHLEVAEEVAGKRAKMLAKNFAAAVLMPSGVLKKSGYWGRWKDLGEEQLIARLNSAADKLHVTASALMWRLVNLGELKRETAEALPEEALRNNGRNNGRGTGRGVQETPPLLFSKLFAEVIARGIDNGRISVRRTARLLDMTFEDIGDLLIAHGLENPIEL